VSRIESAQGVLAERFAVCETMPLDGFLAVTEGLRKSGYRPVRFRPYADGPVVRVAAVWTTDGLNWRIVSGLAPEQIRQRDKKNRSEKFLPVDVAGYVDTETEGKPSDRYAAIWVEKSRVEDEVEVEVGARDSEHEYRPEHSRSGPAAKHEGTCYRQLESGGGSG